MPTGRILYVCPDDNRPIGGIRVIYRHVDLLRRNGYTAFVLHRQPGFRATWFEHDTPVMYTPNLLIDRARDTVVYPEVRANEILTQYPGTRKVIFNQGFFLTFPDEPFNPGYLESPYRHADLAGILVNSRAAAEFLTYAFSKVPIHHLRLSIDPALYHYTVQKTDQIAFMPRRNSHDLLQILNILKHHGALQGVRLAPIDNLSQADAAQTLRDSLFFLTVGIQEGFGLPAAEAMACGCAVIGYHGYGGQEFMLPEISFPITPGDVHAAAHTLEHALYQTWTDRTKIDILRQNAAAFIARTYSPALEEQELLAAWQKILPPK
jgi:hypothetical protein